MLEGGEVTHKLVRVPRDKVQAWDEEHDAYGRKLGSSDYDEDPQATTVDVTKAVDTEK